MDDTQRHFTHLIRDCNILVERMTNRGMRMPAASIRARSGSSEAHVTVNYANPTDRYTASECQFFHAATINKALKDADAWILAQPTADERALGDALDLTAKALEAARNVGIDTDDGAAFVAQLEALMKRLSENVLTDRSKDQ